MDIFLNIVNAAPGLLDPYVILAMIVGTAVGIAVGALPGLSATMGIAVLIPLTFTMEPLVALGMIAGIYNGSMYGGSIPAILLRIPGTPAGIATVFDGHEMAKQGKARQALDISLVSSSIGSAVSAVVLLLVAPPLALVALTFGPADYFWLAVFGMTTIAIMLAGNPAKGILSACFGLCIGIVGIDGISGNERFTFGTVEFLSGIHIVVLLTGLYAIPPAIDLLLGKNAIQAGDVDLGEAAKGFRWSSLVPTWIRASAIGLVVGLIPALGGNIAALLAWQEERRYSRNKDNWGKGEPAGLAAPECANNADTGATLIPALTLGIPGNAVAAVILGALLVHGLRPGPDLFRGNADITYGVMLTMLVTSGLMFVIGKLGAKAYVNVLRVPRQLLGPIILALTVVGVYAIHNSVFEVILMLAFGLIGFAMEKMAIPTAPAVLAVILGPIAEENLRRSLLISQDNFAYLLQSPISIVLALLVLVALASPWLPKVNWRRGGTSDAPKESD